ncbi:MAG: hypothetical protein ACREQC_18030, partial [Candidatus Binataceae bacterium]
QLLTMHERQSFAIEVVDTPPAQQAFDFVEAPEHLARLLDSRAARWLLHWTAQSGRNRAPLSNRLARLVVAQIENFAGARPLSAIAEFFAAAAESTDAIRARMLEAGALIHSPAVNFVLVTTAEKYRLDGARAIARQIKSARLRLAAVVINRVADERNFEALSQTPERIPAYLREAAAVQALASTDRRLNPIARFFGDYVAAQSAAIGQAARFAREISSRISLTAVPEIGRDTNELRWLAKVADTLIGENNGRQFLEQSARALAAETARK